MIALTLSICCRSADFRPCYGRINELRAFLPAGLPMLASTATVTDVMRQEVIEKLEMEGCKIVTVSPNKPNIFYSVQKRSGDIEHDLSFIVDDIATHSIKARRVIVYCRSLDMCADLYAHFLLTLGDKAYYPTGAKEISDNRTFGMYHSKTDDHNKHVIMQGMAKTDGTIRVVFATMALGMGVNFVGLTSTIHYGAPRCIDDYFQESGRAGRGGELCTSTIFWRPSDAPVRKDLNNPRNAEIVAVRRYIENCSDCRRYLLLKYFDLTIAANLKRCDPLLCCDNCVSA